MPHVTDLVGRYREYVERLAQAVLTTTGGTDPSLRQAVEARAAALGGGATMASNSSVPTSLDRYIGKVALHAYQVTDADVDALKAVPFSEDAIFEVTLSAALGAALGRLDRGLAALKGKSV